MLKSAKIVESGSALPKFHMKVGCLYERGERFGLARAFDVTPTEIPDSPNRGSY
jgi:hypothetical protein